MGRQGFASRQAQRGAFVEASLAFGSIANVTKLVTLVQRARLVVDHVAQLTEGRTVSVLGLGGRATGALVFCRAESDASIELLRAGFGVAFVTDLMAVVAGTRSGVGVVAQAANDLALLRQRSRAAVSVLATVRGRAFAGVAGLSRGRGAVIVIAAGDEREQRTDSNEAEANAKRGSHAAESSRCRKRPRCDK